MNEPGGAKKKILIIDDSAVQRAIYATKLQAAGFEVAMASEGGEALIRMSNDLPDLVVLDLMLSEISGLKVLESIKSDPRYSSVKVIVLSAKNDVAEIARVRAAGADDFLIKAMSTPNSVVGKIKEVLSRNS